MLCKTRQIQIAIQCLVMIYRFMPKCGKNISDTLTHQHFNLFGITGKNNGFPILDIFGYLKNTHKNPKFGNLVGNSLIGICLTLPNLGFLWVFFKYPKISKIGNPIFFPVQDCSEFVYWSWRSKWIVQPYLPWCDLEPFSGVITPLKSE